MVPYDAKWCFLFASFRKTHQSSLCLNDDLFRKPTSPPLPLREGPPLISVFSPQGRRGNRSSLSLRTASLYGWRTIRGLRQQRSCSFLCRDKPAFTQGFAKGLLAALKSHCWYTYSITPRLTVRTIIQAVIPISFLEKVILVPQSL